MISDQERLDAFLAVTKEVDLISQDPAVRSRVPELAERLNIGADGFYVVTPSRNANSQLQFDAIYRSSPTVSIKSLKIYPFFLEDASMHNVLQKSGFANGALHGSYMRDNNQIFLNTHTPETMRAKACFFIHELGHALAAKKNGFAMSKVEASLQERIFEEMEMRTFDANLVLALGGSAYRVELDRGVYWLKKAREKKSSRFELPSFRGRGSALSIVFGSVASQQIEEQRDALFQLYCDIFAADQNLGPVSAKKFKCKCIQAFARNLSE